MKVFAKITELLLKMNEIIDPYGVKFGAREEYSIEYLEEILSKFAELAGLDLQKTVRGRGHHKTAEQRLYERLFEYLERLKKYAEHNKICGEDCGSYSKTDHDATFMRMKRDHMGNNQLLPAYDIQCAVCDGYIAAFDVCQRASDMDCFQPLMERFNIFYAK